MSEALFQSLLPLIDRIIDFVARRRCLSREDKEDFASIVKIKLIDDDYAVLRKYRGEAKMSTYLTTVITRLAQDFLISKWGKWTPSARAKQLGETAVQLDILLYREGHTFPEAVEILRTKYGVEASLEELEAIAAELPPHPQRHFEGEDALTHAAASGGAPEDRLQTQEREDLARRFEDALTSAFRELPEEDRTILNMRFGEGMRISAIARLLDLPAKSLYRRIERIREKLRHLLEAEGLRAGDLKELFSGPETPLSVDYGLGETSGEDAEEDRGGDAPVNEDDDEDEDVDEDEEPSGGEKL